MYIRYRYLEVLVQHSHIVRVSEKGSRRRSLRDARRPLHGPAVGTKRQNLTAGTRECVLSLVMQVSVQQHPLVRITETTVVRVA